MAGVPGGGVRGGVGQGEGCGQRAGGGAAWDGGGSGSKKRNGSGDGAGAGAMMAASGRVVDWVRVPVMWGGKVEAYIYVGRRDGKMAVGVRGRFKK